MPKVCDMDCFNCKFDDCIKDDVYSDKDRYCNRSEKQKQYQREYQKKKRDEARAKGLCIICRKLPATNGSKCLNCYLRQKRHDREKYDGKRDRWMEDGKCYFCGSEVVKGKKVIHGHIPPPIFPPVPWRFGQIGRNDKGRCPGLLPSIGAASSRRRYIPPSVPRP